MSRFLLQLTLFLAIIVGVDYIAGFAFRYLEKNAKGGMTFRDTYICDKLETDILISGSSRCVRHYNPQIITDSLGLTCYNSGQMGNGVILNYGRLLMVNERRKPLLVIYDLHPSFDLLHGEDNHKYLSWLKSHYERDGIAEIFESVDKTEKYKMMSKMYRYNSRIVELLTDYIHPIDNARNNGFSPLKGELDLTKIRENNNETKSYIMDNLKLSYIEKMIEETNGGGIVFVVSPSWYGMDSLQFAPVKEMCKQRKIPFYDFSNNSKYVHNDKYFKDGLHMNECGADEFTRELAYIIGEASK